MRVFQSKFYQYMDKFSDFVILNLIWLIMCIPIVTIFPATAAMFSVIRKWIVKKEVHDSSSFFMLFKENLKQGFSIGLVWSLLGTILVTNLIIVQHMNGYLYVFSNFVFCFIFFLYLCTSIYLFPVMVHYKLTWTAVIKTSFLLSISQFIKTILAMLVFILMCFLIIIFPFLFFILFSAAAYMIYLICHKAFEEIEKIKRSGKDYSTLNSTISNNRLTENIN